MIEFGVCVQTPPPNMFLVAGGAGIPRLPVFAPMAIPHGFQKVFFAPLLAGAVQAPVDAASLAGLFQPAPERGSGPVEADVQVVPGHV
jgi:hypothetical protein